MPPPQVPAGASGPGKYSQRTDGGPTAGLQGPSTQAVQALPNAKYGENKTFQQLQQNAPLAKGSTAPSSPVQLSSGMSPTTPGVMPPSGPNVVPFSAPTQRPNEPVTSGAMFGPGPGPEVLGLNPATAEAKDMSVLATHMPVYEFLANLPDALPSARMMVNMLKIAS